MGSGLDNLTLESLAVIVPFYQQAKGLFPDIFQFAAPHMSASMDLVPEASPALSTSRC